MRSGQTPSQSNWQARLPDRAPLAGEVHLWLDDGTATRGGVDLELANTLSNQEQQQQERFVTGELRRRFLRRRIMLRQVLSHYRADISPARWRFCCNAHGRPAVDPTLGPCTLSFNLSHTQGRTLLAIAAYETIGVDIEHTRVKSDADLLEVASQYFTSGECRWIFAAAPESRVDRFFDLWTLKEAYIKALGVGLSLPLDSFEFAIDKDRGDIVLQENQPARGPDEHWAFDLGSLPSADRYAVAMRLQADDSLSVSRWRYVIDTPGNDGPQALPARSIT